jgi:glutamate racemase
VEEGWLNKGETRRIVKKYLHPLKVKQIDTLILGCTHYPLLKETIQVKIGKRVKVIDSSEATAFAVKRFLDETPQIAETLTKNGRRDFFVSDVTDHMQKLAGMILKRETELQHIPL